MGLWVCCHQGTESLNFTAAFSRTCLWPFNHDYNSASYPQKIVQQMHTLELFYHSWPEFRCKEMTDQPKVTVDLSAGRCGNSDRGICDLWHQMFARNREEKRSVDIYVIVWAHASHTLDELKLDWMCADRESKLRNFIWIWFPTTSEIALIWFQPTKTSH